MEDERQTLIDATIHFEDGKSILEFEKQLKEEGEIGISPGVNTFLWAHGNDNEYSTDHGNNRGSFQLNILGERDPGGSDAVVDITSSDNQDAIDVSNPFVNATIAIQSNLTAKNPSPVPMETSPFDEVAQALLCPPGVIPFV